VKPSPHVASLDSQDAPPDGESRSWQENVKRQHLDAFFVEQRAMELITATTKNRLLRLYEDRRRAEAEARKVQGRFRSVLTVALHERQGVCA
jgi:hypothetical protein